MADTGYGKGNEGQEKGDGKGKDKGKGDGKGPKGKILALKGGGLVGGMDVPGKGPTSAYTMKDYNYAEVDGVQLALRVYIPDGAVAKNLPCVFAMMGSAFFGADMEHPSIEQSLWTLDHGYAVVVCPYRGSANGLTFPTPLQEVVAGFRYVVKNADEMGIDASRIASYGGSSGAWLASMLAVSTSDKFKEAGLLGSVGPEELHCVSTSVCCTVSIFCPWNFATMQEQLPAEINGLATEAKNEPDSVESIFMGFPLQTNLPELARASPLTYLGPETPPIFLTHGDADPLVPVGQSREAVDKLKGLNIEHEYREIAGGGHATPQFGTPELNHSILTFLRKHCPVSD